LCTFFSVRGEIDYYIFQMVDDVRENLHVPHEWEALEPSRCRGILMIIGEPNTGKSTLGKYLFERLTKDRRRIAFIDGDPGQSRLGPPTTMSLCIWDDNTGLQRTIRHAFIGSISPSGHMLQMLIGAYKLVHMSRACGADAVVYDTSGLIDPSRGGLNLKLAKIDLLRPNRLFGIQREQELEALLAPLRISALTAVTALRPSPGVRRRDILSRKAYRAERYANYFSRLECLRLDFHNIALFPGPALVPDRLVALEDAEGFTQALGIVREYCRKHNEAVVLTPLDTVKGIRTLRPGVMLVDPQTFEDRFNYSVS
jgi:polynucleotide 5'-hydroxyl-kinase GRC3/NOL9